MKRIMCIWFPNWPIQRRHRSQLTLDPRPSCKKGLDQLWPDDYETALLSKMAATVFGDINGALLAICDELVKF